MLGDRKNMSSLQVDIEWLKVSLLSQLLIETFYFIFDSYSNIQWQAKTKQMIKTDVSGS